MAGLLDIAPSSETITVRGTQVEVTGISVKGLATLLGRYPELQTLIQGGEVDVSRLMELGGDIVGAIIAAGCGNPGDERAEAVASNLALETQADLITAIIRQTMPGGVGPFVARLESLGAELGMTTSQQNEPVSSPSTMANGSKPASPETSELPLSS